MSFLRETLARLAPKQVGPTIERLRFGLTTLRSSELLRVEVTPGDRWEVGFLDGHHPAMGKGTLVALPELSTCAQRTELTFRGGVLLSLFAQFDPGKRGEVREYLVARLINKATAFAGPLGEVWLTDDGLSLALYGTTLRITPFDAWDRISLKSSCTPERTLSRDLAALFATPGFEQASREEKARRVHEVCERDSVFSPCEEWWKREFVSRVLREGPGTPLE